MSDSLTVRQLRLSRLWLTLGCVLIAVVVVLSLIPGPGILPKFRFSDKFGHVLAYAALMGWFGQIYQRPLLRLGYAFSFVLLGVMLEFVQWIGGVRHFEIADMVANATGVACAWYVLRLGGDGLLFWFERRIMGLVPTPAVQRELP